MRRNSPVCYDYRIGGRRGLTENRPKDYHRKHHIPVVQKDRHIYSNQLMFEERSEKGVKNVVIGIIMFAIAIVLIVGVIIPIAEHGKTAGQTANTRFTTIDASVTTLAQPIN